MSDKITNIEDLKKQPITVKDFITETADIPNLKTAIIITETTEGRLSFSFTNITHAEVILNLKLMEKHILDRHIELE